MPSEDHSLPGFFPGWDWKDSNGNHYPNDVYAIKVTVLKCCGDANNTWIQEEFVTTVTKAGNPPDYQYIQHYASWFPTPCCLKDLLIMHRVLSGHPRYIVRDWISVAHSRVDQYIPSNVYLQAPEINLLGETVLYAPNSVQHPAIINESFTAIAAPCTPNAQEMGCSPKPSLSGKMPFEGPATQQSNSYWATAPPQVPVYYLTEGPEGHLASRSEAAEPFTGLSVYPNPADQELHITLPAGTREAVGEYRFRILDSQGRELPPAARTDLHPTATLGIAHLAAGFYVLEVSFGASRHYVRFVKS
jgi:hypothetical protein